jgi:hypothetical protein
MSWRSESIGRVSEETKSARRLKEALMNVGETEMNGDGLDQRPAEDSLLPRAEEDSVVFAMSSQERGPGVTTEHLSKR